MNNKYIISLDIGTNSVGWAVMNEDFSLAKSNKKITSIEEGKRETIRKRTNLWGVRLFEEGKTAAGTRGKRGMRRRISRRKKRLIYLREIFEPHIGKFDDSFFIRMNESFLQNKDDLKKVKTKYPLFNGKSGDGETFADEKDYYQKYPTIYHLRQRLLDDKSQADLRLVYLAMHHILKFRGNFIYQGQDFDFENLSVLESLKELLTLYSKATAIDFSFENIEKADEILTNRNLSRSKKAADLTSHFSMPDKNINKQQQALYAAIVGNGINVAAIFGNDEYKNDEIPRGADFKYSKENYEETLAKYEALIAPEEFDVLAAGKKVYEAIVLCNILTHETLSASMKHKYEEHGRQLEKLKQYAKEAGIFDELFGKEGAYTLYVSGKSREVFYKKLTALLAKSEFWEEIKTEIEFDRYMPKQRMSDNGAIPYQVHEYELLKIIENQKEFYPFLGEMVKIEKEDDEGKISDSYEYKIQTLMKFRIPYYVGPLTPKADGKSRFAWLKKQSGMETENITPWNFGQVVDKEASAIEFIDRMTNFCTYLPQEKVLPDNSLIYQEFKIYNELITCGWCEKGSKKYFNPDLRAKIVAKLFKKHKKVSADKMILFLRSEGYADITVRDLFGIDILAKSPGYNNSYSTYIDFINAGISAEMLENNRLIFEEIIKWQTIFEDKKILRKAINSANKTKWDNLLSESQIKNLAAIRLKGWGRLSAKLLTGIRHTNGKTILENLKEENFNNFMRLIEDEKIAAAIREGSVEEGNTKTLNYGMVADLAGSPALKKGIWQSLKIIKELESHLGMENISKVVLEIPRGGSGGSGRTKSRKRQIEDFYSKFTENTTESLEAMSPGLKAEFADTHEKDFDKERIFLYFLQNAKCMYSGKSLTLGDISSYEVDHIIPQTLIKDDSIDNKVLVKREENQNKGGDVPSEKIVGKMKGYWEMLAKNGQVSKRKLANLTIGKLTDKVKEDFINRQLVETRQITKHVANILLAHFEGTDIEILTPRSSLTHQFRDGIIYVPDKEFDYQKELENGTHFEHDGKEFLLDGDGEFVESKYNNSNFVKVHFHEKYHKNRGINDYHHAHDAYLNAVVAHFIYGMNPELRELWVYGKYHKRQKDIVGKEAFKRRNYDKQLLTGMAENTWEMMIDNELVSFERDEVLGKIQTALGYRNMNIVKKTEKLIGKFGDETIYKKDANATPVKRDLNPALYGGTKAPVSAFTVVVRNNRGIIEPLSMPSMSADGYLKSKNRLEFIQLLYPSKNISEIILDVVPKYTKYIKYGIPRLLASYKEAQCGVQLPPIKMVNEKSSAEEMLKVYDSLADFIAKNQLFSDAKITLLKNKIKDNFAAYGTDEKLKVISELLRVSNGSNQGLNALKKAGLETTAQQLTSKENLISNDVIIISQSVAGLYETRRKIK
ncbi:MAG: type II CRISPR RNA-guided endonuclease Cas9 [Lachnospiraceae bacterium]|nr:type II CRISPR RNA-guided endonuclease Cas9 [Lachnospiraceae bacterium]